MSSTRRLARLLDVRASTESRQPKSGHPVPELPERVPLRLGAPDR